MASEQILDIGAAKQLFVDERIIAEAKDLERTLNQPAKDTLRNELHVVDSPSHSPSRACAAGPAGVLQGLNPGRTIEE